MKKILSALAAVVCAFTLLGLAIGVLAIAPIVLAIVGYVYAKRYSLKAAAWFAVNRTLIFHRLTVPVLVLLIPVIAVLHAGVGIYKGIPGELRALKDVWQGRYVA